MSLSTFWSFLFLISKKVTKVPKVARYICQLTDASKLQLLQFTDSLLMFGIRIPNWGSVR